MNKYIQKPKIQTDTNQLARFERFNLKENPFPAHPVLDKDSPEIRINGEIYENTIREKELEEIKKHFLKNPQHNPNHLRLGYLIDRSYIGRGNGKSAFLVNLVKKINEKFCLDISENINKCFAIHFSPDTGGRTKSFVKFADKIFESIIKQRIIDLCLAIINLKAIYELDENFQLEDFKRDDNFINALLDYKWYEAKKINYRDVINIIKKNKFLQELPEDFDFKHPMSLFYEPKPITQEYFSKYLFNLKKPELILEFIFDHLISIFQAADFNGAYIFVDDFERILEFQSSRQMRDFAFELRSCLFDGMYKNAKLGFMNFFLVIHSGVHRLIHQAWSDSGMDHRAPITSKVQSDHIIPFGKLTSKHTKLLIKKYLDEFRIYRNKKNDLFPFTEKAVVKIGEIAELNAAKILQTAYSLLEHAAKDKNVSLIDISFIEKKSENMEIEESPDKSIAKIESTDLTKKIEGKE